MIFDDKFAIYSTYYELKKSNKMAYSYYEDFHIWILKLSQEELKAFKAYLINVIADKELISESLKLIKSLINNVATQK